MYEMSPAVQIEVEKIIERELRPLNHRVERMEDTMSDVQTALRAVAEIGETIKLNDSISKSLEKNVSQYSEIIEHEAVCRTETKCRLDNIISLLNRMSTDIVELREWRDRELELRANHIANIIKSILKNHKTLLRIAFYAAAILGVTHLPVIEQVAQELGKATH